MLTGTQTARIESYLATLERALADLPPDERTEVMIGVREHIEAALAGSGEPTDTEVDAVLSQVGDPLAIAATARPGAREPSAPAEAPLLRRDWVPTAVVLLMSLGLIFFFLFFPWLLWLTGATLLWLSPLWRVGEKLLGTVLPLVALGAVVAMGSIGWSATSCSQTSSDPEPVCTGGDPAWVPVLAWALLAMLAVVTVATMVVLWRRGIRRVPDTA